MQQYLNFLKYISQQGISKTDRTGTGTFSIFGYEMRFNLQLGFPLVTTKKLHIPSIFHELLWFLKGETNIHYLKKHHISIWDEWADAKGELGPIYGKQWRAWQTADGNVIDQIQSLVDAIHINPDSRRLIVSAWNVADLDKMALPPCHLLFQFYVSAGYLSCKLTQRSADAFLGVPFNIASYALLTHLIAHQCHLKPGELIWSGGDCHIYHTHKAQVELQLTRNPLPLPTLTLRTKPATLFDYQYEDIQINNYQSHAAIKAVVAI